MVEQGISVYGNKGSTDQHAYVQQLRDGVHNFFVTFIEVLEDRQGDSPLVDGQFTSGDYLHGFFLGTRQALADKNRASITLTLNRINAYSIGLLIALFERTVGLYASLVNINAYHQPGVEAGKKAAAHTLDVRSRITEVLKAHAGTAMTATEIAKEAGLEDCVETIFKIALHASANNSVPVERLSSSKFTESAFVYST